MKDLQDDQLALLGRALEAMRAGDAGQWQMLAPLARLAAEGVDVEIDMFAESVLGVPLLVARPRPPQPDWLASLSPRQRQVAMCIALGQSNKAIARALGISPATVKDHVHAVLSLSGLPNRGAVTAALSGLTLSGGA